MGGLERGGKIPDDKVLVPGVLDTTSNYIEHPELVAQRLRSYADIVGPERVIAGTDCGFGTFAGFGAVDPTICWAKLARWPRVQRWPRGAPAAPSSEPTRSP